MMKREKRFKKTVCFLVTEEMFKDIKEYRVKIADICREAIELALVELKKDVKVPKKVKASKAKPVVDGISEEK